MDAKTTILEWFRERIGRDPCPAHVAEFEARPLTLAEAHALPTASIRAAYSRTAASIIEEIKRCSPSLAGRQAQPPAWVADVQPAALDEAVEELASTGGRRRGPRVKYDAVEAASRDLFGKPSGGPRVPDEAIERISRGAGSSGPSDDAVAEAGNQMSARPSGATPSDDEVARAARDLGL